MYEKVVELGDPKKEPFNEIFNQLDLIRAEFIDIYRFIIVSTIDDILSGGWVKFTKVLLSMKLFLDGRISLQ